MSSLTRAWVVGNILGSGFMLGVALVVTVTGIH
jgi:hypothetical protein